MIASYATLLTLVMRHLTRTYDVPGTAWLGLLAYPLAWGLLMLAFPDVGYEITPILMNGTGLVIAWLVCRPRAHGKLPRTTPGPSRFPHPPGEAHPVGATYSTASMTWSALMTATALAVPYCAAPASSPVGASTSFCAASDEDESQ